MARSLNSLASLYAEMGDYAKATPLFECDLRIREAVLGPKHPDTATSLNNLAKMYQSIGNDTKAESLYQRSLEIQAEVLGEKHPEYATTLHNLASLYYMRGDYAKAEPLYVRALEIQRNVVGTRHPEYAKGLGDLGALYIAMGDIAKAEPLLREGLEVSRENLERFADIQSERQQLLMAVQLRDRFDIYLSLALREVARNWCVSICTGLEGRRICPRMAFTSFSPSLDACANPEDTRLYNEFRDVTKSIASIARKKSERDDESQQRQIAELSGRRERLEEELHQRGYRVESCATDDARGRAKSVAAGRRID